MGKASDEYQKLSRKIGLMGNDMILEDYSRTIDQITDAQGVLGTDDKCVANNNAQSWSSRGGGHPDTSVGSPATGSENSDG